MYQSNVYKMRIAQTKAYANVRNIERFEKGRRTFDVEKRHNNP